MRAGCGSAAQRSRTRARAARSTSLPVSRSFHLAPPLAQPVTRSPSLSFPQGVLNQQQGRHASQPSLAMRGLTLPFSAVVLLFAFPALALSPPASHKTPGNAIRVGSSYGASSGHGSLKRRSNASEDGIVRELAERARQRSASQGERRADLGACFLLLCIRLIPVCFAGRRKLAWV